MAWTLRCNRCMADCPPDNSTHGLCLRCHQLEATLTPSQPGSTPSARATLGHFTSLDDAQAAYRASGTVDSFLRWLDNNGVTYRR